MAREVRSDAARTLGVPGAPPSPAADTYLERVLKYIPAEVVALYLAVFNVIKTQQNSETFPVAASAWGVFAVCLAAVPVYLRVVEQVRAVRQLAISTLSFALWVCAVGGPQVQPSEAQLVWGAIALPIFTFFVGLVQPRS